MPYNIELMCLGADQYALLDRCAVGLNGIQDQFQFNVTNVTQRHSGLTFRKDLYLTDDVWDFLEEQRSLGGRRPFIIAFIDQPLESQRLSNLFASHSGERGLAIVTCDNSLQFVKDEERYISYYLTRYAHTFVNPKIRSHEQPERKDCYFHKKMNKREILYSINSASLCDVCSKQLDMSVKGPGGVHKLAPIEREALMKMREFVAGQLPYSLILKGGGIKGLALAGALVELGKYFSFDRYVGTSAGAIAAVLLAAGFKPSELVDLFDEKDFTEFLDAKAWTLPFNLILRMGLFPGESFRLWIANLLSERLNRQGEVRMEHLDGAVIYGARSGQGTITFDSDGQRRETVASFAVRCSMSIPFFFQPVMVEGRRVFDGGLRNNFPLKMFKETNPGIPFLAIYLGNPDNRNRRNILSEILDIVVDGEERDLVDNHQREVVIVDTRPIGTVDFRLSDNEKRFLIAEGRAAALELIASRKLENGPSENDVMSARSTADSLRDRVIEVREGRKIRRRVLIGIFGFIGALSIGLTILS